MVWCSQCATEVEVEADEANGFSCCVQCGRVVEDTAFSSDVMFSKGADGDGELMGQMVGASGEARGLTRFAGGRVWTSGGDGHETAVSRGRFEISALVEALRISPSSEATEAAHRLYKLALQRGFTRGRRVNQVAAVCLYIFCRLEKRPYMLIDFSDHLSINVYALGGVFLQMLRLLRLDEHAAFTKPIDPSLYLNRFVDRLRLPTQELKTKVTNTAMRLVQSMKRDWMLTGRRPSGICGAALFLAAHIHGVEKTKKDVIGIVHIGWGTVEKRVLELAETRDADLTLRELDERDKAEEDQREQLLLEYERNAAAEAAAGRQQPAGLLRGAEEGGEAAGAVVPADPNAAGQYCEHVRAGTPLLAHGMCRGCLEEYLKVTMAVQEGAYDPPAYLRNLRRDIRKRVRAQFASESSVPLLKSSGEVLAIEGPEEGADVDIHERRHLENEAALEASEKQELAKEAAAAADAASAAAAAGPSTSAPAAETVAATAAAAAAAGATADEDSEEEEEFDTALRSSDLQPLARALGGVAPAVASALAHQRPARAAPPVAAAPAAVEPAAAAANGAAAGGSGAGAGASDAAAAASAGLKEKGKGGVGKDADSEGDADGDDEEGAGRAKRARKEAAADGDGEEEEKEGGRAGGSGTKAAVEGVADDGVDDGSSDNLSDVDDDEIAGYLATREEATVREQLWVEMNKDWIEQQEAKKAAGAEEAAKQGEKTKRKYNRKTKPEQLAAEDAAGATRNLLAAKKLSNKINYGALEDLFGGADPAAVMGAGSQRRSASPDFTGVGGAALAALVADDEAPAPAVAAALAKRAATRARAQAADAEKYSTALEEETRKRSSLASGGGFLDSLTFARSASQGAAGGRARPQGLGSLKPRGR